MKEIIDSDIRDAIVRAVEIAKSTNGAVVWARLFDDGSIKVGYAASYMTPLPERRWVDLYRTTHQRWCSADDEDEEGDGIEIDEAVKEASIAAKLFFNELEALR